VLLTEMSTAPFCINARRTDKRSVNWIGDAIRKKRLEMDLSLRGLSAALQVDHTALCRYESGERRPSAEHLPLIADFLGISAEKLRWRAWTQPAESKNRGSRARFIPPATIDAAAARDRSKFEDLVGRSSFYWPSDRDTIPRALFGLEVIYDPIIRGVQGSAIYAGLFPPGSTYRGTSGVVAVATNSAKSKGRKVSEETMAFHVLHEVGHYRLHWLRNRHVTVPVSEAPLYCSSGDRSPEEYQANAYASAFLMPKDEVFRLLGGLKLVHMEVDGASLCRHFFVEPWTLKFRLNSLGIRVSATREFS